MTGNYVIRNISRADRNVISGLEAAGVAPVHEAYGRRGLLDSAIRPIQEGISVAGSAVTVLCPPGDNMMLHAAVEVVQPGDLLVVTTTSPSTDGMFGDLLATSLIKRGAVGLVIEAGVRDTAELRTMGFPVWSRAIHAQGTVKATPGSVNVPVVCAGMTIEPGDVVIADDDGVVVVSRSNASEALAAANARIEKEEVARRRLEAGELGLDFYGPRDQLGVLGVRWVESQDDL